MLGNLSIEFETYLLDIESVSSIVAPGLILYHILQSIITFKTFITNMNIFFSKFYL